MECELGFPVGIHIYFFCVCCKIYVIYKVVHSSSSSVEGGEGGMSRGDGGGDGGGTDSK